MAVLKCYLLIVAEHREVSPQVGGGAQHWAGPVRHDCRRQRYQHHSAGQHDGAIGGNTRCSENFLFVDWRIYCGPRYASSLIFNILRWKVWLVCWLFFVVTPQYTGRHRLTTSDQPVLTKPSLYWCCNCVQSLYRYENHPTLLYYIVTIFNIFTRY